MIIKFLLIITIFSWDVNRTSPYKPIINKIIFFFSFWKMVPFSRASHFEVVTVVPELMSGW